MKVKYHRERPGKKFEKAPRGIEIFDDDGNSVGEISFDDTAKHGMEIVVYSYSPKLDVAACSYEMHLEANKR